MLKQNITDEEVRKKIDALLNIYPDVYSRIEKIHIYQSFYKGRYANYIDNVLQEVLDEIGVLEERTNFYKAYIDLLEKNYSLNQPIVEVGGGRFSRVAKRIAKRQTSGTIKVYDPKLIPQKTEHKNLFLLKKNFDYNVDLENTKLLTGLLPCDATYTMIEMACKNKIDFQIALCDCLIPKEFAGTDKELEAFHRYAIDGIKDYIKWFGLGNLVVTDLKEYGFSNPIIYTKK